MIGMFILYSMPSCTNTLVSNKTACYVFLFVSRNVVLSLTSMAPVAGTVHVRSLKVVWLLTRVSP